MGWLCGIPRTQGCIASPALPFSGSPAHPHPCKSTQVLMCVHTYTLAYIDTAYMFMSMSVYSDMHMCTAPMFRSQDHSSVCSALPILPWMFVLSAWSYSSCWRLQRQEPCADDSSSVSEMHRETLSSLQMSAEVAWLQEAAHACSTAGQLPSQAGPPCILVYASKDRNDGAATDLYAVLHTESSQLRCLMLPK